MFLHHRTALSRSWSLAITIVFMLVLAVGAGWLAGPGLATQLGQLADRASASLSASNGAYAGIDVSTGQTFTGLQGRLQSPGVPIQFAPSIEGNALGNADRKKARLVVNPPVQEVGAPAKGSDEGLQQKDILITVAGNAPPCAGYSREECMSGFKDGITGLAWCYTDDWERESIGRRRVP